MQRTCTSQQPAVRPGWPHGARKDVIIMTALRARSPSVPILLTSGYTSSDTVKQMLEEGTVQGFLAKPYQPHELLDSVQRLLHRE